MSSHNLPPVRNLPHWSRVGCLDKPCAPRPLPANNHHLQPLPGPALSGRGVMRGGGEVSSVSSHSDMDTRVASLQRNIQFLQLQQKETLQKLHAEIDGLRRENKELQYKLIMDPPKSSRKASTHGRRSVRPAAQGSELERGLYLEQPLQDTRPLEEQGLSEPLGAPNQAQAPELRGGLITSLHPLRIHSSPTHPPRAPTLQECEVIIRQLYNANSIQSQEIMRVKAVLRDIVFNKKITPENYILTRAYLTDGNNRKAAEVERFPQLALQQLPKKMSRLPQAAVTDGVILPALKQSLSSNIAERHKRTHAVQRSRLKRTVQTHQDWGHTITAIEKKNLRN